MSGNIQPFTLENFTVLENAMHGTSPWMALVEGVRNALAAGAKTLHIVPLTDGGRKGIVIIDDGCGMGKNELLQYLGKIGGSGGKVGRGAHMGFGVKEIPILTGAPVVVISWTKRSAPHRIELTKGTTSDGRATYGILPSRDGSRVTECKKVPYIEARDFPSGTIMEIHGLPWQPYRIMMELNARFLDLSGVEVRVWRTKGDFYGAEFVKGLLPAMERVCGELGKEKYRDAILHWGIRRQQVDPEEATRLADFESHYCKLPGVAYAWRQPEVGITPEVFKSWSPSGPGLTVMTNLGVTGGFRDVILILEAKGAKIAPAPDRCGITRWRKAHAAQQIMEGMPEPLATFMNQITALHGEVGSAARVREIVAALGFIPVPRHRELKLTPTGNGATRPSTKREAPRRSQPSRGYPNVRFVEANEDGTSELGSDAGLYNSLSHEILVNMAVGRVNQYTRMAREQDGGRRGKVYAQALEALATEVVAFFSAEVEETGEIPTTEQLASVLRSPVLMAGVVTGIVTLPKNVRRIQSNRRTRKGAK